MLRRLPARRSTPSPEERRRERRRQEQIRYRERHDKSIKVVRVPIDGEIMNWLLRHGYCSESDLENLDQLGRKIGAVLAVSARD
jgi:hypothetical protein